MFDPTRTAGLETLRDFVPRAGSVYARQRNIDTAPHRTNVSTLSPYIRHRLVTEREVVAAVLEVHSLSAAEKFVQEVMWRTYWKGWLEQNPEVWRRYRRDVSALIDGGATDAADYRDAVSGRTGIDAMDAWVGELVETGYLHNHTRMWFASIWIFTLRLPWQLGADFFYRHLLDGDAASNTLSWRWVAGLQTVGKTYLATASNIARYTEGRFHPEGLATAAHPLTEDPLPARTPIPEPEPATPSTRVGVLLHEEDLDLGSLAREHPWLDDGRVVAIAASQDAAGRSPSGVSDAVDAFTTGAVEDAVARATHDVTVRTLAGTPAAAGAWAASENLDAVVVPYAPVGPVAERMTGLRTSLRDEGIALSTLRRDWDTLAWPHARRGFFPFRTRIPTLLAEQGIPGPR
ncbi:FAD-binding domain-containing protein [Microbacterium invictum]|uniref:FAD-binding domain-containing protein n=1 Tax=Microbacterium invictum TaxID=515415 RepID=A0ABZ0VH02_9MICO|nr:FAD-binding domain-containing protein [Microbacterium invictum]WQB71077.1 FAD-binding domain-containing protein [Microbacterium invictum]